MLKHLGLLFLCLLLSGCYYLQAAAGQLEVVRKREPVAEVINDPDTSPELAARLRLLSEARDFSIAVLGLPDNKSYRTYSDLERDYVVWNVFAAPEFSFTPKQWCFPIAGCVSYRGYFAKSDALRESKRLADDGYDVAVGGVAAYSTLGKLNDPILSTMMPWDDIYLVAVLFHELAHQVVYVKGDTAFNESFATAVEEVGVHRWLEHRGELAAMGRYQESRELQQRILALVNETREGLLPVYESDLSAPEKRVIKRQRLDELSAKIATEMARSGRTASAWLGEELNNARLISTTLYEGHLPYFRELITHCNGDLRCFYAAAKQLAELDQESRDAALASGKLLDF